LEAKKWNTLKVSEDGSLFTVTTEGDGSVERIIAFLEDIISHPEVAPGKTHLIRPPDSLQIPIAAPTRGLYG
jgi:hypothetical protein